MHCRNSIPEPEIDLLLSLVSFTVSFRPIFADAPIREVLMLDRGKQHPQNKTLLGLSETLGDFYGLIGENGVGESCKSD